MKNNIIVKYTIEYPELNTKYKALKSVKLQITSFIFNASKGGNNNCSHLVKYTAIALHVL